MIALAWLLLRLERVRKRALIALITVAQPESRTRGCVLANMDVPKEAVLAGAGAAEEVHAIGHALRRGLMAEQARLAARATVTQPRAADGHAPTVMQQLAFAAALARTVAAPREDCTRTCDEYPPAIRRLLLLDHCRL